MARRKTRVLSSRTSPTGSLDLATRRREKGISLEQIAEVTKISIRFLRAIEDEEFEKLPGGIFNTSYLRQYAAATGLEEGKLLAYYDRRMNPVVHADSAPPAERGLFERCFRLLAHESRP